MKIEDITRLVLEELKLRKSKKIFEVNEVDISEENKQQNGENEISHSSCSCVSNDNIKANSKELKPKSDKLVQELQNEEKISGLNDINLELQNVLDIKEDVALFNEDNKDSFRHEPEKEKSCKNNLSSNGPKPLNSVHSDVSTLEKITHDLDDILCEKKIIIQDSANLDDTNKESMLGSNFLSSNPVDTNENLEIKNINNQETVDSDDLDLLFKSETLLDNKILSSKNSSKNSDEIFTDTKQKNIKTSSEQSNESFDFLSEETKQKIKNTQVSKEHSTDNLKTANDKKSEAEFLNALKERIAVLFEGLKYFDSGDIEARTKLCLKFCEFTLASIDERLRNITK